VVAQLSILLRDPATGDLGVATVTSCPGGVPLILAGAADAGLVVNAGKPNSAWTQTALARMRNGDEPAAIVRELAEQDVSPSTRLFVAFDRQGRAGHHCGRQVTARTAFVSTETRVIVGNGLVPRPELVERVQAALDASEGLPVPERLLLALQAATGLVESGGLLPGGLIRLLQVRGAGLLVLRAGGSYDGRGDRLVDLRVDYSDDAVAELLRNYRFWVAAVLHPRLLQMQKELADPASPLAAANRAWLERLRARRDVGQR
jgi:uncharacterized Ntn-hydrolase superfamily protein